MNRTEVKQVCSKVYLDRVTSHRSGRETLYEDKRTEIINNIPYVWPIGLSNNQVYIICPHCGKIHSHGIVNGKYEGTRMAHCDDKGACKKYYIKRLIKCIGAKH